MWHKWDIQSHTDIILDCLHNIYTIKATVGYFLKLWIFPSELCICYGSPNLNYVFEFYNSYIRMAELCTIHNEPNYVRIMYEYV